MGAVAAAASVVYDERCWLEDISWRMQIALRWRKWQKWIQVKDVQGLRIFMIKVSWSIIAAYQSHDNIFYRLIILRKGLRNFMIEVSGRLQQHTKAMALSFKRVINLRKSFSFTIKSLYQKNWQEIVHINQYCCVK